MRKFIISDIHGFGNLYYSVMGYLDNISEIDDIELYINGDLIDRGLESAEILLDVKKRIEENKYSIIYLGGNHELLMYQEFENRKSGKSYYFNDWYLNGGYKTDDGLYDILQDKNKIFDVVNFVSNLNIYHKFSETIDDKEILLVHSACPFKVFDKCDLKIKDDNEAVINAVWTRDTIPYTNIRARIGNSKYFTIIGHTPNNSITGYTYNNRENFLNIDGGASFYVSGYFNYNHFPLVEICNGYLKILTFDDNNRIIHGNYFNGENSYSFTNDELEKENALLNKNIKTKKLTINEDGIVGYWK